MKKTILMMLLAGSSCAVFAQVDSSNRNTGNMGNNNTGNTNSNGTYNNRTTTGNNSNGTYNNGTMNGNSTNNSLNSNTSYNAYGSFNATPPEYVQSYVLR